MTLSVGVVLLSQSGNPSIWGIFHFPQLLAVLLLLDVPLPSDLKYFLQGLTISSLTSSIFDSESLLELLPSSMRIEVSDEDFVDAGITYKSTFTCYLSSIVMLGCIEVLDFLFIFLRKFSKLKNPSKFCPKLITNIYSGFTFNIYVRMYMESMFFLMITAMLEITSHNMSTTYLQVSFDLT